MKPIAVDGKSGPTMRAEPTTPIVVKGRNSSILSILALGQVLAAADSPRADRKRGPSHKSNAVRSRRKANKLARKARKAGR